MLLQAVTREPRSFIVPGGGPVNVPMSPVLQPRLVRDASAADAIVAVAPEHAPVPADLRAVANRLEWFRYALSNPTYAKLNDAAPRLEHNGEMPVEATLAGAVASLERHGCDLFDGLHQFADFGGLVVCVVAALPLGTVMALVQAPLDPELVFAEAE